MNIALFSPSKDPYSETFIQVHKNHLKDVVFYYYGSGAGITLDQYPPLYSTLKWRILQFRKILFSKNENFPKRQVVVDSLKKRHINVALVEYGLHAHRVLPILKKANVPLVVHFHGYDASAYQAFELTDSYKEVFNYATSVIVVSRKMEEMLLEIGCPKDKIVVNVSGPRDSFLQIKPTFTTQQFLCVGRFTDKKAPYYTLLAFREVVEKYPNARLIMAGKGTLLNTCINLASYLGIENQVEFVGVINETKLIEYLTESLAFVQHSIRALNGDMEGTPISILEASAAGIPVVATNHAGIPDVVVHEKTGFIAEEHDVKNMSDSMLKLLENIDLAKKMGSEGKKRIKENFSLAKHIDSLQATLEKASKTL